MRHYFLGLLVLVTFGAAPAAADPLRLTNGGFSSGLSGWSSRNPMGTAEFIRLPDGTIQGPGLTQAGSINVQTSAFGGVDPISGAFLCVGTGNAWFLPGQGEFEIVASQTLTMGKGETLSGLSAFFNGDFAAQDSVWVRIRDAAGNIVAMPWFQRSGGATYGTTLPWTQWQWSALAGGNYTIEIGATTFGDNRFSTHGMHDAIRVPEPSALMLLVCSLIALTIWRRRNSFSLPR